MGKNVGTVDAYIRVLIGISFFLNIIALETGVIGTIVLLALGLSMIVSAFTGYCWIYGLLKIDTCPSEVSEEKPAPSGHH